MEDIILQTEIHSQHQTQNDMRIHAQTGCKINIGLNIVSKRADGYHNLETVFYPVPLFDELTITDSTEDGIDLMGHPLDGDPNDNLVLKVVRLLREHGHVIPPVHISLCKNIPSGAGLGGGSSDAACVMKELNRELSLGLSCEEMERTISRLGADCPFFIQSRPVYAEGIGDIFSPVSIDLAGYYLVLVKPDDHISTKEAYSLVRPKPAEHPLCQIVSEPVETWQGRVVNDFEQSVFPGHPGVEAIRSKLYAIGASYACMSGSGSTVFGLFRKEVHTDGVFPECFTFQCKL